MTKEQKVYYDMYERVVLCGKENAAAVALNPIFQTELNELARKLPEMLRLSSLINAGNDHAETKKAYKNDIMATGVNVCTYLGGYGLSIKDKSLEKMGTMSKSALVEGKEEDMLERCQNIADKARSLLKELETKRGMKEVVLTKFETAIAQYRIQKPLPRSSQQDKSALIDKLEAVFDDADVLMTLLSSSLLNFNDVDEASQTIASDFVARFKMASVVISAKVSKTKTKFIVENSETKEKITDYNLSSTALNLNKTLLGERSMSIPTVHHKGSDFVISKDGFETVVLENKKIKKGKTNVFKVVLKPI